MSCPCDWELPCGSSGSYECSSEEEQSFQNSEERRAAKNLALLREYVNKLQYCSEPPRAVCGRLKSLAVPRQRKLYNTYIEFKDVAPNKEWKKRMGRAVQEYRAIPCDLFAEVLRRENSKQRKIEAIQKRKKQIYLQMLTRMEQQCREQYITVMMRKFANYVAKLATNMSIPPKLEEPYARMHRGLFCNILQGIGLAPDASKYCSTEYESCYKLAHALLSLMVQGINTSAETTLMKNPEGFDDFGFNINDFLQNRLMCAASKKVNKSIKKKKQKKKSEKGFRPLNLGYSVDKSRDKFAKCESRCYM